MTAREAGTPTRFVRSNALFDGRCLDPGRRVTSSLVTGRERGLGRSEARLPKRPP